jgi:hypothetical protein
MSRCSPACVASGNSVHLRAADPHHFNQSCCPGSRATSRKLHQELAEEAIDRVPDAVVVTAGGLNAVLQPGLSSAFFAFRQAIILVTFGISEPHKRKTSGVHAARSSADPNAMLEVEYDTRPSTRTTAQGHVKIAAFFMTSPPKPIEKTHPDYLFVGRRSRAPQIRQGAAIATRPLAEAACDFLKDGRRLGLARLTAITTAVTDAVYEKLLVVTEIDAEGNAVERERKTTVNHAMKSCRRAWNIAARRNPGKLPTINPFAAMGLISSGRETPTATFDELKAFRAKAGEMGYPSLATAALLGWEWLQREEAIFGVFDVAHYRPKERPHAVRVLHPKTDEENWVPLFDEAGVALYPELMAELDTIKSGRIGGLMKIGRA